jgi:hypothetical protein
MFNKLYIIIFNKKVYDRLREEARRLNISIEELVVDAV